MVREKTLKIIYSKRVINYLANNRIYPAIEFNDCAYYYRTRQLSTLLDRFMIETIAIPNRQ